MTHRREDRLGDDVQRYARRAASAIADLADATIHAKSRSDLVTSADLVAEQTIRDLIAHDHPAHDVVAEEAGGRPGEALTWWVDPLDGTNNFIAGSERWAISIAVTEATGVALHAAVYAPATDDLFVASRGTGAWHNGQRLHVSTTAALADAIVASGFGHRAGTDATLRGWARLTPVVRGIRCSGSAALDLCDVARGRLDGYFERGLGPWDTAAGTLIATEAGAAVIPLISPCQGPLTDLLVSVPALTEPIRSLVAER